MGIIFRLTMIATLMRVLGSFMAAGAIGATKPALHCPELMALLHANEFTVSRGLWEVSRLLGKGAPVLLRRLRNLKENDIWVDFGAGSAHVQLGTLEDAYAGRLKEYLERTENGERNIPRDSYTPILQPVPKCIALSLKRPPITDGTLTIYGETMKRAETEGKFIYHEGLLRDISPDEINGYALGTDTIGVMQYTQTPSEDLLKMIRAQKVGGALLLVIVAKGLNPETENTVTYTTITPSVGAPIEFTDWLTKPGVIEGAQIERLDRVWSGAEAVSFVIRRTSDAVDVSELALERPIEGKSPPQRWFKETGKRVNANLR